MNTREKNRIAQINKIRQITEIHEAKPFIYQDAVYMSFQIDSYINLIGMVRGSLVWITLDRHDLREMDRAIYNPDSDNWEDPEITFSDKIERLRYVK